jgi:hypothetical protein
MGVVETLIERNERFAKTQFNPGLLTRPTLATIVICCVDTRVDPTVVLGAETRLAGARVSGLVYDVTTGLTETIVNP